MWDNKEGKENMKDKYYGISPRIARWKLNTPLENWLGYKADHSEFWKKIYVFYYRIFDSKYYNRGLHFIKEIIQDKNEEWENYSEAYITRDMIYSLHRFGLSFQDYCIYNLIDKNCHYKDSFISDKLRYHYCDILNSKDILPLMTNKHACYLKYKQFYKREVVGCFSEKDFPTFKEFVSKHHKFIYKPLNEHSGHGISIYSLDANESFIFFQTKLKEGSFVVEEIIEQNIELAQMHPQSVNTFRVVTFTLNDTVKILGVTWRIGIGNAVLDNAGAGGIYANIDSSSGIVVTDAISHHGEHYYLHPDTKKQIIGYQIPQWKDAISFVTKLATHLQGTTLISWDIALSNNGWVLIEANDNGAWRIIQANKQIGKKKELYSYMDEYFK